MVIVAVGDSLEDLLKREVVKSGDGLHLGLSPTMMKFFTMEGPFIGVCSATCICVNVARTHIMYMQLYMHDYKYDQINTV